MVFIFRLCEYRDLQTQTHYSIGLAPAQTHCLARLMKCSRRRTILKPHGNQLEGRILEPVGIPSPPTSHPTTYEKGIMDNYIREEITCRIFFHGSPSVQISYVLKTLIINKEELVLDKEREILSPKSQDYLS